MEKANPRKKAVILVDLENTGLTPDCYEKLKAWFRETYDIALAIAFDDLGRLNLNQRTRLHLAGFLMVDCPAHLNGSNNSKDVVDFVMTNFMSGVIRDMQVDEVLLMTRDRDFSSASNTLRDHGIKVRLVRKKGAEARLLKFAVDSVIDVDWSEGREIDKVDIEQAIREVVQSNIGKFPRGFSRKALLNLVWKELRAQFSLSKNQMRNYVDRFISKHISGVNRVDGQKYIKLSV